MPVEEFPLGIATGAAFCNRQEERERLIQNIRSGRHTWIIARRRFGKSSLVAQVLLDMEGARRTFHHATVDLLLSYDAQSLDQMIRRTVGELSGRLLPPSQRALRYLSGVFGNLRPEIVLAEDGVKIKLLPGQAAPETLVDALEGLNRIASRHRRRSVLVFDEFQQLGLIRGHAPLEAAIRHAAQAATHVSYVFLGSERHLLSELFEDPARPLYQLCERLSLHRISEGHYARFLLAASQRRWRQKISEPAIAAVFTNTLRHPHYLNVLCGKLWQRRRAPSVTAVDQEWDRYVQEEHHRAVAAIVKLSANQRAVLGAVARVERVEQPNSQAFLQSLRLSSASVRQALDVLIKADLAEKDARGVVRVADPVVATYLRNSK